MRLSACFLSKMQSGPPHPPDVRRKDPGEELARPSASSILYSRSIASSENSRRENGREDSWKVSWVVRGLAEGLLGGLAGGLVGGLVAGLIGGLRRTDKRRTHTGAAL